MNQSLHITNNNVSLYQKIQSFILSPEGEGGKFLFLGVVIASIVIHFVFFLLITLDNNNIEYEELGINFSVTAPLVVSKPSSKVVRQKIVKEVKLPNDTIEIVEKQTQEEKEIEEVEEVKTSAPDTSENLEQVEEITEYIPFYSVDKRPRFLSKAILTYPFKEKRQGKGGVVIVEVDIDALGTMRGYRIIKSAGDNFDQAVIDMVVNSTYSPGYRSGKPVAVRMRFPIVFKIQ